MSKLNDTRQSIDFILKPVTVGWVWCIYGYYLQIQGAAILPNRRLYKGNQNSGITKRYIIAGAERFLFPFPCTWYSDIGPGGLELRKSHSLPIRKFFVSHYGDVIMGTIASQISSLTIVYSTVYSHADQRKHQSSASLAFVWGIHRGPVNSPHKWPVTRKMFPFDDVIM